MIDGCWGRQMGTTRGSVENVMMDRCLKNNICILLYKCIKTV